MLMEWLGASVEQGNGSRATGSHFKKGLLQPDLRRKPFPIPGNINE